MRCKQRTQSPLRRHGIQTMTSCLYFWRLASINDSILDFPLPFLTWLSTQRCIEWNGHGTMSKFSTDTSPQRRAQTSDLHRRNLHGQLHHWANLPNSTPVFAPPFATMAMWIIIHLLWRRRILKPFLWQLCGTQTPRQQHLRHVRQDVRQVQIPSAKPDYGYLSILLTLFDARQVCVPLSMTKWTCLGVTQVTVATLSLSLSHTKAPVQVADFFTRFGIRMRSPLRRATTLMLTLMSTSRWVSSTSCPASLQMCLPNPQCAQLRDQVLNPRVFHGYKRQQNNDKYPNRRICHQEPTTTKIKNFVWAL